MNNQNCRVSGKPLEKILDFGLQPLGNGFVPANKSIKEYFYEMQIGFCPESRLLQLINQPEPERMFHDQYAFFSSTSKRMAQHFKDFAESALKLVHVNATDPFVIELGCNDGILLRHFSDRKVRHLGIEPSENVAKEANKIGVDTISQFFSAKLADQIVDLHGQADLFIAANVMCHIPDILDVAFGIQKLLKPNGVAQFEDPYLGDVLEKTSYDQIYDEHVFLFSCLSVEHLFEQVGLELVDAEHQSTHGGSMRYTLAHKGKYPKSNRVINLIAREISNGLGEAKTYHSFAKNVQNSRDQLIGMISNLKKQGMSVAGYAATSKSTTILNFCKIGPEDLDFISDTTPIKIGTLSPGMHIPVKSHDFFKEKKPDVALLFAWNHVEEIMGKELDFTKNGGKWLTHVPKVKLL